MKNRAKERRVSHLIDLALGHPGKEFDIDGVKCQADVTTGEGVTHVKIRTRWEINNEPKQ